MQDSQTFMKIDIAKWVFGTIKKVQQGTTWNCAWQETYRELGGNSPDSGKKVCPMKAAETLYLLGRIKDGGKERKNLPLHEALNAYSKNGAYAIIALEELESNPGILKKDLWEKIKERVRNDLGEKAATFDQGGCTVAFKLWHIRLIV